MSQAVQLPKRLRSSMEDPFPKACSIQEWYQRRGLSLEVALLLGHARIKPEDLVNKPSTEIACLSRLSSQQLLDLEAWLDEITEEDQASGE